MEATLPNPDKTLDYEDLALFEILEDPVLFQEFMLPPPDYSYLLRDFKWSLESERSVWYHQYPFLLWPRLVCEAGRSIGKTVIGMSGATAYDMVNLTGAQSGVCGPSDQHTMRVFDGVVDLLTDHRYLNEWLPERFKESRRSGVRQSRRQIRASNGWQLHGLIPGRKGIGFKGEHPRRLRGDEMQDTTSEGWKMLDDAVSRPFLPIKRSSLEHHYGVPDGDRSTVFYQMCNRADGVWARWRRRMPSFLSPLMSASDWIDVLQRNECQFIQTADGRVIVTQWTNYALQNILGMWGDPVSPCFPRRSYERCTVENGVPNYHKIRITPGVIATSGGLSPETVVGSILADGPSRTDFPELSRIYMSVDPGPGFCAVHIWGKMRKPLEGHTSTLWLIERLSIEHIMDTVTQSRIVDRIANYWSANWVGSDSTSQSVFVADVLCNEDLFGFQQRMRLRYHTNVLSTNAREPRPISEARGWKGQVIVPVDFSGTVPAQFNGDQADLKRADVFAVRVLQNLMRQEDKVAPILLLPTDIQDQDFFAEVTSFRENLTGAGPRFYPAHPHNVSAMLVLAVVLQYAELLDLPTIESSPDFFGGVHSAGNIDF